MRLPKGLHMTQAQMNEAIDAELKLMFDDVITDRRDPEFAKFIGSINKPGSINTTANRVEPPERAIFQRIRWNVIALPDLWTTLDEARAEREGWAVGDIIGLPTKQSNVLVTAKQNYTPSIGKLGRTFITDGDAHAWVATQAKGSGKSAIYNRALAVIAAITIKRGA